MSEPSSDPLGAAALFSPVRSAAREPSSDAPVPAESSMSAEDSDASVPLKRMQGSDTAFSVVVPSLSSSQKAGYQPVAERDIQSDEEFGQEGAERIVGEAELGPNLYFYVRYNNGVIYSVSGRCIVSPSS